MKTYFDHLQDLSKRNVITQKEMFMLWDKYNYGKEKIELNK